MNAKKEKMQQTNGILHLEYLLQNDGQIAQENAGLNWYIFTEKTVLHVKLYGYVEKDGFTP
ncbi:hypothetical protein KQI82_15125 [Oscillibacter sp. MSJ-2]|uniref:Uncharacterized protein n=1 Tax=Dysosmobacter acutus TaxID=2841504 RepID=A0ABS6FDL4_9FIRM|nr:hypothetical protein [Dysosmobacter acutus]MBU5628242.1 hypothetical protein [Dysosmobacter acutus]